MLSEQLVKAIRESLMAFFKSLLYRLCRYESEDDRRKRISAMQALLDAEHAGRVEMVQG